MCGGTARQGHLVCRACWGAVPADVQRQVNVTWRALRTALAQRSPMLREHVRIYRRASAAAIAAAEAARP